MASKASAMTPRLLLGKPNKIPSLFGCSICSSTIFYLFGFFCLHFNLYLALDHSLFKKIGIKRHQMASKAPAMTPRLCLGKPNKISSLIVCGICKFVVYLPVNVLFSFFSEVLLTLIDVPRNINIDRKFTISQSFGFSLS
jgi:hypothetical protein